jgi:chromosome segregation ATPase
MDLTTARKLSAEAAKAEKRVIDLKREIAYSKQYIPILQKNIDRETAELNERKNSLPEMERELFELQLVVASSGEAQEIKRAYEIKSAQLEKLQREIRELRKSL